MRLFTDRVDSEELETVGSSRSNSLVSEAYSNVDLPRRATANATTDSLDFGTLQDLYGGSVRSSSPQEFAAENGTFGRFAGTASRGMAIGSSQASEKNRQKIEKSQSSETPAQVDSLPENTPANFNVETPSSGYADEAAESNSNPSHGVPDSDTVSTDTQPAPVTAIAVANATAFDPCCNVNTQQESVAPDPDGMNAEGQTEGSAATAASANDSSNSNTTASDAEGGNSSGGTDGSNGSSDGGGD